VRRCDDLDRLRTETGGRLVTLLGRGMPGRRRKPRTDGGSLRLTHSGGDALPSVLGPLEEEIMEVVWSKGNVTVHDVQTVLRRGRPIAYTTVATTMGRLNRKGLLNCDSDYHAHRFEATVAREEYARSTAESVFDWLVTHFPKPAVAYFLDRITDDDELVERLRRELAGDRK
jgi:predicted transcriptional regulator